MTKHLRPLLFCSLASLTGCFSLSHGTPVQKHYVLGAPDANSPRDGQMEGVPESVAITVIGLRPPRVADYLDNAYIVVRHGTHRVGFSEFDRWGEELARGVHRTLADRIAARSPAHHVEMVPWPSGTRPEHVIQVHLQRFEGVMPPDTLSTDGEAHLLATWEILDPRGGAVEMTGTTDVRSGGWTAGDFDALVGLLDAALDVLAEDLVLGLERVRSSSGGFDPR
ncbi:MAG: PqiC family protein [Longimicrobiales bacterium]|nr:PqiC family protein [Longimicrobiales bacterium]